MASTALAVVPPLRQSIYSQMSCEHGYSLIQIEGLKPPNTPQSNRGTEVHEVLYRYAVHCTKNRIPADFAYLDDISQTVGQEAADILEVCKENIQIDWQNFFGGEIAWGLDDIFRPTHSYDHEGNRVELNPIWGVESSGEEPAYCGIFDALYLMPGEEFAVNDDYKTHPRAFEADTFQTKLYSLAVLMHLRKLREVRFQLRFVRYANVNTSATFQRSDVPRLMEDVRRVRAQQLDIHERWMSPDRLVKAHGGAHCVYCPSVADKTCPLASLNPMTEMSAEDRLSFRLWLDVANRENNRIMKEWVKGTGEAIHSTDGNGKAYTFGEVPKEKVTFPLFKIDPEAGLTWPIVEAIVDWITDPANNDLHPKRKGTLPFWAKLRIGATELNSALGANSREILDNRCKDLAVKETKPEMRVTRDAEVDDGTGEEHRKEWED